MNIETITPLTNLPYKIWQKIQSYFLDCIFCHRLKGWDEPSQPFHLSCQRALPSGLPSKGNIPLKSLFFSVGTNRPNRKAIKEAIPSRVQTFCS